jgi:hypothetical protein
MHKRMQVTSFIVWFMKGWNSLDIISHLFLVAALILRLAGLHTVHIKVFISTVACCAVLLWSKMLFFMMPFSTTGVLAPGIRLERERRALRVTIKKYALPTNLWSGCKYGYI